MFRKFSILSAVACIPSLALIAWGSALASENDRPVVSSADLHAWAAEVFGAGDVLPKLTGWTAMPTRARINGKQSDCLRILSAGKAPFQVENTEATITVANGRLTKAVLLDLNGLATPTPVEIKQLAGKATVVLPANTVYLVLQ